MEALDNVTDPCLSLAVRAWRSIDAPRSTIFRRIWQSNVRQARMSPRTLQTGWFIARGIAFSPFQRPSTKQSSFDSSFRILGYIPNGLISIELGAGFHPPTKKLISPHFSTIRATIRLVHLRCRRILSGISSPAPSNLPRILIYSPRARELVRKRSGILAAGGAVDAAIHGYPRPGTIGILSAWHPMPWNPAPVSTLLSRVSRVGGPLHRALG